MMGWLRMSQPLFVLVCATKAKEGRESPVARLKIGVVR